MLDLSPQESKSQEILFDNGPLRITKGLVWGRNIYFLESFRMSGLSFVELVRATTHEDITSNSSSLLGLHPPVSGHHFLFRS